MKLNKFYSLRKDFVVIGLTGRLSSGCSEIAKKLSDSNFMKSDIVEACTSNNLDELKYKICFDYLSSGNWTSFMTINYKNVIMLHFLYECLKDGVGEAEDKMVNVICQNGASKNKEMSNRFDLYEDLNFIDKQLRPFLVSSKAFFESFISGLTLENDLNENLKSKETAYRLYFELNFLKFCDDFYEILNSYHMIKRTRFTHDLANSLRQYGKVGPLSLTSSTEDLEHIYTIAETINRVIKGWRSKDKPVRFVIDSLKNSLEIMYFKEKFSAFYMIASNKRDADRESAISESYRKFASSNEIGIDEGVRLLKNMDNAEFKIDDFKQGHFYSPDVENCIQKCDYHIFIDNVTADSQYASLYRQLIKLVALINKPGLVTPTLNEHFMQIAYNAKSNSGCISRQVGAVVTDKDYSIKAIGWNDVPEFQVPCGLRDIRQLFTNDNTDMFSDYERHGGNYRDGVSFKNKAQAVVENANLNELDGRNCSFCFRDFHNAFEGEKNQVHTRSLHAEENAMMQITKFGGIGIKGGKLFTTASPCELCSKKAFQLGISEIFYIDPYPGIATTHTLKSGVGEGHNPSLIMFQGAVGRAFHKLYEPFISPKDEIAILTKLKPKARLEDKIRGLTRDEKLQEKIAMKLKDKTPKQQDDLLDGYIRKIIDQMD